jgi:maleate isomerase
MDFTYQTDPDTGPSLGLIVLQADETLEPELRRMIPQDVTVHVTRVPSGAEVTPETLAAMEAHLAGAAALLPAARTYDALAYGCTSGTAQIGPERVAERVRAGARAAHVTEPVSALIAACGHLGLGRLAFLSPYVAEVSGNLRRVLAEAGIETPVFGSFDTADEATVARIALGSIAEAACTLVRGQAVDGLFLSCTNLRTLDLIAPLEDELGLPVLSSNLVLGWHMGQLADVDVRGPGRLFG